MSFLADLGGERPDRLTPERVYASIDPDRSDERGSVVLEAVEADWFDQQTETGPLLLMPAGSELDWHVSLVEVRGRAMFWLQTAETRETEWFELTLRTEPSDDVLHFVNLFAAPDQQRLERAVRVPPDLEQRLNNAHSLDPLPDASEAELTHLLSGASEASAAAVYDVGQGACTALIAEGTPRLYFDFGGGSLWNASTYPRQLQRFCFSSNPTIVLSHWDTDHWATALRDTRALPQAWIVPRQGPKLRSNQLSFLIGLINAAPIQHVYVWGQPSPPLTVGGIHVERCTGSSINDSGLALTWHEDNGPERMLFPADASYDDVPAAQGVLTTLVVSHHGGHTGAHSVPRPDGAGHGRLVYSFGRGNGYGHPLPVEEAKHSASWGAGLRTPTLRPDLGHVHLYWSNAQPDAIPACGGANCQLLCRQR